MGHHLNYISKIFLILTILIIGGFISTQKVEAQTQTTGCWQNGQFIRLGFITRNDCESNGVWVNIGDPVPQPPHGPTDGTPPQNQGTCWVNGRAVGVFPNITTQDCQNQGGAYQGRGDPLPPPPNGPADPSAVPAEGAAVSVDRGCGFLDVACKVTAGLANLILTIASFLTGIAAIILNGVIFHTVVDVSNNYAKITSISETWKVVRDIANMAFIFVLLYAAIKQIIGAGGENQKLIVRVVTVAILINFSLFFTRVVIDISNVMALTFYDAIAPEALQDPSVTPWAQQKGLSNAFMNHMNLQSLWKSPNLNFMTIITVGVMGTIMLLIAAFSFFAVAILFIIRYVILILVLVLSPIAFIAYILPSGTQIEKYRKQWVDALIGQSFFAPIYFILTWVTLNILSGVTKTFGGGSANVGSTLASLAGGDPGAVVNNGAFVMLINFIIVIVLLIASLIVAKSWADKAGGGMSKLTSSALGFAGGATLGVAGRFGRGTIGRAGQALAENEWLKSKAPTSVAARLALASGRKTAGASFDVRGAGWAGSLDAGKAQKGGFAKDLKDKIDTDKKYADSLKPSEILVSRAERTLEDAKKTGDPERIRVAQVEVDRLKGATQEEMRKREIKKRREAALERGEYLSEKQVKAQLEMEQARRRKAIREMRRANPGMTHEEATNRVKATMGWEPDKIKGVGVERKEAYAKDKEASTTFSAPIPGTQRRVRFSLTNRVGFVGPVKRERLEEAAAIRKSVKEKKASEKIAEEIGKQSQEAAESEGGPETTPPSPTPSPGPSTP